MEPEKQTNEQEKQTTDTEDKQMVARGVGSGSGEKKKVTEIMHVKPLDCGDHFKMYIYMTPSHVYLNHIQLLSTKLKKVLKIKF